MKITDMQIQKLHTSPLLIYGAGRLSKIITNALLTQENKIVGIAVTNPSSNEIEISGIKVHSLETYIQYAEEVVVLIATSPCYHEEIMANCKKHGFKDIIPLSVDLQNQLYMVYYEKIFLSNHILLEQEVLSLDGGIYLNPFTELKPYSAIYLDEMGDLILPTLFNDYRTINEGPYELGKVHLSSGDIVLDLGSNMGLFSVYAASKGCIPYAFEPAPNLQSIISRHSKLNRDRIQIVPYAVSDKCGQVNFYLDSFNSGANSLGTQNMGGEKSVISVQQITVDEFVRREKLERVDFIKADIEGAERLMLAGAMNTLREFAPKLALCTYHLPDDKEVMTELILRANPNYKISYKWMKLYATV